MQCSSFLAFLLLILISALATAAALESEKVEESDFAVKSVLWRSVFHLLSKLRAWMIKVKRSRFKGVDLVFLLMKEVRNSLLFLNISGILLATFAAVFFCCVEMFAGVFA